MTVQEQLASVVAALKAEKPCNAKLTLAVDGAEPITVDVGIERWEQLDSCVLGEPDTFSFWVVSLG